jgi:hypothetical protein
MRSVLIYKIHEREIILDNSAQQRKINPQISSTAKEISALKVFPNPAQNTVYLEYHTPKSTLNQSITITNAQGITTYRNCQNGGDGQITLDVKNWSGGLYFVTLKTGSSIISTEKLTVVNE